LTVLASTDTPSAVLNAEQIMGLLPHRYPFALVDRVLFTGQISGIGSALEFASAKVLTSHSEGLPRVLIECALAGVPSLSTKVSGVGEVYGNFAKQFVLESRSPSELAKKLKNLLDHREGDIIETMKISVQRRFSKRAHVDAWNQFLALSNPESSRAR
jgi:glycosyltransferase involved in cell wall biosynthesis